MYKEESKTNIDALSVLLSLHWDQWPIGIPVEVMLYKQPSRSWHENVVTTSIDHLNGSATESAKKAAPGHITDHNALSLGPQSRCNCFQMINDTLVVLLSPPTILLTSFPRVIKPVTINYKLMLLCSKTKLRHTKEIYLYENASSSLFLSTIRSEKKENWISSRDNNNPSGWQNVETFLQSWLPLSLLSLIYPQ